MKKFADWVIRLRIPILIGVVVFTAFSGYSLKNLKINSDILSYLPQDDPNVVLFNKVGEKFGGNSLAMVALEGEDVFSYEALTKIRTLTRAFEEVEGVTNVMSLTNILDIKKTEDGLEVGKLIDKRRVPQDKSELEKLRAYTLSKEMYVGSLISEDGRMTTILCRVREDVNKDEVGRKIRDITEQERGNLKAYYAGVPLWMAFINDIISSDLVRLVPLVTLLVMLTLYVSFRTFRGVALPLATVMMSALWTVGLMPLFGVDFSLVSNGIPVLLIAIGSAYGIHMINKYNEDVRSGDSRLEGIRDALSEVGLPIVLAGVTTLIGFLSFLTSNLSLIREFGLFTALGVLFALIISVTFLPAALSFLKVKPPKVNHEGVEDTAITRFMNRLGAVILRREKLILIGAMVVVGVVVAGLPKIKREVNMVEYFKENNPIRVAEEVMEQKFGGAVPVQIYVRGEIKNPFVLKKMRMIERFMATVPHVNDPQSIADLICEINEVMNGRYEIPDTEAGVGNLWFFLEGNEVLDQLITPDHKEAVIQAKLGTIDTKKITDVVNRLEHYLNA
ncbi:MAG: MMPL family transporter, partial [Candidatus Latescibacteria bacterium]|nr:MMPL family transporter [Candidatus Latescibacterota bacterium]